MDPRFEDRWRTRFEEFAEVSGDDAGIAGWSATGLDARLRRFLALWKPSAAGDRWLDAGCGAGTYTRILSGHGLSVIGLDYSLPTIRKAIERNVDAAAFVVADVRRIPLRPGCFDGVLCFGVTQALVDSRPAVQELALQVKTDGELWIDGLNAWCVVHAYDWLRRHLSRRPIHLRYESPTELKRVLHECGFTVVRLHWMPIVPGRLRVLQWLVETRPIGRILSAIPFFATLISHAFIVQATKRESKMENPRDPARNSRSSTEHATKDEDSAATSLDAPGSFEVGAHAPRGKWIG